MHTAYASCIKDIKDIIDMYLMLQGTFSLSRSHNRYHVCSQYFDSPCCFTGVMYMEHIF